jgi:hypothetical protein
MRLTRSSVRLRARGVGHATFVLAALLALLAVAGSACDQAVATPTQRYTAVPIGPTPWASGTTGQYGLHIDPSLFGKLPHQVGAQPIVEDAESESVAMDNADLARTFDGYAAGSIGELGDDNWLKLMVAHFRPENQNTDVLSAWIDQYAAGACSQANAVSSSTQETINGFIVDVATCGGGPVVYTVLLDDQVVLSMFDFGPKQLGRQLIEAIY